MLNKGCNFHYLLVRAEEFGDIATALGERVENLNRREAAERAVTAVIHLIEDLGMPSGLAGFGVTDKDLPQLADQALQDSCLRTNPRTAQKEDIIRIYQQAL